MRLTTFNWLLVAVLALGLGVVGVFSLQDPFAILVIAMFSMGFGWIPALALAVFVYLYHRKRQAQGLGILMAILSFLMLLPTGGLLALVINALWQELIR